MWQSRSQWWWYWRWDALIQPFSKHTPSLLYASCMSSYMEYEVKFFHLVISIYALCLSCHIHIIPQSLTESLLASCLHNTNSWPLSAWGEKPKEDRCLLLWKWHRTATFYSYLFPFKALVAVRSWATYKFSRLLLHSWSCSQPRVPGNFLINDKTIRSWLASGGRRECNWS